MSLLGGATRLPNASTARDPGGQARNGYLIIQTTLTGEAITSVEFSGGSAENIDFDVLQFRPIPEPSSLSLLGLGLGGVSVVRRWRRARPLRGQRHGGPAHGGLLR